jgi:hypothetical protein
MAGMRKEMDANQAKADAKWKAWRKRMAVSREKMNASLKEMVAEIKPEMEIETTACEEMEAHLEEEEPALVDMKTEVAQDEKVPVGDAIVMPVEEPKKKRRRDRNQRNMNKMT